MASHQSAADVARLVEEAADLFDRDELQAALARVKEAVASDPSNATALRWHAHILAELGQPESARLAYEDAVERCGHDLDVLIDAADFYVTHLEDLAAGGEPTERGLELARQGQRVARQRRDDEAEAELALIAAMALSQLGRPDEALSLLDQVARARPDDPAVMMERGFALYELSRFDEARAQLLEVARRVPEEAWAHHTLGLIAERVGDRGEATRRFERAFEIAPDEFPRPIELPPEEFDAAVEEWIRASEGWRTPGRSVQTKDRDQPTTYVQIVEFPSYEAAMENSERPETARLAERLAALCDAPPTFRNLDVVREAL